MTRGTGIRSAMGLEAAQKVRYRSPDPETDYQKE